MDNMVGRGLPLPAMFALPMPAGDVGTFLTLGLMRLRVLAEMARLPVRTLATRIVEGVGPFNGTDQAVAIREYIEEHTVFLRDPDGAELLHSPEWQVRRLLTGRTLYLDCDDIAMLAAALGKAIGLKARFIVVGFGSPTSPYRHVWTELRNPAGGPWVECDVTRSAQGFDAHAITRRKEWSV